MAKPRQLETAMTVEIGVWPCAVEGWQGAAASSITAPRALATGVVAAVPFLLYVNERVS